MSDEWFTNFFISNEHIIKFLISIYVYTKWLENKSTQLYKIKNISVKFFNKLMQI